MENINFIIQQLKYLRKIEFYNYASKLGILLIFVVLSPIAIYEKTINSEFLLALILIFAEIVFLVLCINFYNKAKDFSSIKRSRLYQCIEKPELLNEIIVSDHKILFEIKGMEDETIYIRDSEYRDKIIDSIKSVFGSSIVIYVKKND